MEAFPSLGGSGYAPAAPIASMTIHRDHSSPSVKIGPLFVPDDVASGAAHIPHQQIPPKRAVQITPHTKKMLVIPDEDGLLSKMLMIPDDAELMLHHLQVQSRLWLLVSCLAVFHVSKLPKP